jgi:hypothetical protein
MSIQPKKWNKEMFTKFQCEKGLIMHFKTGKNADLVEKYMNDAMEQMTDDEFVAMNERISIACFS